MEFAVVIREYSARAASSRVTHASRSARLVTPKDRWSRPVRVSSMTVSLRRPGRQLPVPRRWPSCSWPRGWRAGPCGG